MKKTISLQKSMDISEENSKETLKKYWDEKAELVYVYVKESSELRENNQVRDNLDDDRDENDIYNWHYEETTQIKGILLDISNGFVKIRRSLSHGIYCIPIHQIEFIMVEEDPECWVVA